MRKVVFTVTSGLIGCRQEEKIEFEESATDNEIGEALIDWANDRGYISWHDVED